MFRCLSSPNLVGPVCVIGEFNFERTMSSRSQVKFLVPDSLVRFGYKLASVWILMYE